MTLGTIGATQLENHGDVLTPSSDQVLKILTYAIANNNTNSALAIMEVASPNGELLLQQKGASDNGVIGLVTGNYNNESTESSSMPALYITDDYSIRLNGALGSTGDLCYISYIRVQ